jgi:hypothetical protein
MARRTTEFETIRSEGGLLPPDLLRRVLDPKAKLDGTRPEDYGLPEDERLNETITQSWNRLRKHWAQFRSAVASLPEGEAGTGLTNDKWSLPLLRELGFGLLPISVGPEVAGRTYAINRFFGPVPIHLVGCGLSLDRRAAGVRGAAAANPHGLVQEFLNRSPAHLWAIVANGLRLRILRDNQALSRQSFLEFDLEAVFTGEVYSDFVLLWLLAHATRFAPREGTKPETCWLEHWTKLADEQGTRALGDLRGGVEKALQILGEGFTSHPRNIALRESLRSGQVQLAGFHGQLLRVVYRLIFLFVAEDRTIDGQPLLHPRDDTVAARLARERYAAHYSTARLRELASKIKGSRHGDLWRQFQLLVGAFSGDASFSAVREHLALPALGSFLWDGAFTAALADAELTNYDFLEALRHLAFTRQGKVLRPVDYKNLGAEELGGVYESLLALTPQLSADGARFNFAEFAGSERKTSGSYYTPDSLVQCLLDSALDPVVEEAIKGKTGVEAERAILALKVCDPAVGSGHFLVGAAHRLARHLARVRALAQGESEPSPLLYQHALRDVIGRCLYGVDINPMAAELCRVSLWLEALEPGKPLSFLDHHIRVGNSLLGTTPALLAKGIPDEAFEPIEGDDRSACTEYRRLNRDERLGQETMFDRFESSVHEMIGNLAPTLANLAALPDDTLEGIRSKEKVYADMLRSSAYENNRLLADAWCAAFVIEKKKAGPLEPRITITEKVFRMIEQNPHKVSHGTREEIKRFAHHYRFFHWHLAFPNVFRVPSPDEEPDDPQTGWSGGFDLILGNPPWDSMSPDAKEFFSTYDPKVRTQDHREVQTTIINSLLENPVIGKEWKTYCRDLYAQSHFFKKSGRYRLFARGDLGKGDLNVYRIFVETALQVGKRGGWVSQVVPEALYNGANSMAIRKELFEHFQLESILGFENHRENWFKGIDSRTKFCIYSAKKDSRTEEFRVGFNIRDVDQLSRVLGGPRSAFQVELVKQFSPDSLALIELSHPADLQIAAKMYKAFPAFGDLSAGPPYRFYMREIDKETDRKVFDDARSGPPYYEGRMVGQYDYRAKGYRSGRGRAAVWEHLSFGDQNKSIQPQWYIPSQHVPQSRLERIKHYRIGFCDVGSPTNERTLVAALIPPNCISAHTLPTITFHSKPIQDYWFDESCEWAYLPWLGVANSFCMDFLVRQKVSLHVSYVILDSLPFPRFHKQEDWVRTLSLLSLKLSCTDVETTSFWNSMVGPLDVNPVPDGATPPGLVSDEDRLIARAQIEAIVAKIVFRLSREEVEYILETFPIVKEADIARYGDYRIKLLILEYYDSMASAPMSC